jgi:DNA-binding NarL/FixJ family response regulator
VGPAVLICDTDIGGESGLDLCRWTRRVSAITHVVILTGRDEPRLARSALAAGAVGYLLKDTAPAILTGSLDSVMAGSVVVDARLGKSRRATLPVADGIGCSRRESDVLAELLNGLDNKSIAGRLCISEETVKSHLKAIFRKLGARDRAHAIALVLSAVSTPASPGVETVPTLNIR